MSAEFSSKGYLSDYLICLKHDIKRSAILFLKRMAGRKKRTVFDLKQRYSSRYAKNVILRKKLAITDGKPSWFYTAFERGDADALTNYSLGFIDQNLSKEGRILVTGCGTGITVFHLAEYGYKEVVGTDLLPECIDVADQLKNDFRYDNARFLIDNGFDPAINEKFDLITALHWVFSAWMGNYGNPAVVNAFDPAIREQALNRFLSTYSPLLNEKGILIIELTDAVADYRLAADHPMGDFSLTIYPIRHSPAQVESCAAANGFEVMDKKLSVSYGHHPRTSYYLRKK
jgi:SAM-dependent methyltransferase